MSTHTNLAAAGDMSTICTEEVEILDRYATEGDSFEDYSDELKQAAFDHFWDGETNAEDFKEQCWQLAYGTYKSYVETHPTFMAIERARHEAADLNAELPPAEEDPVSRPARRPFEDLGAPDPQPVRTNRPRL
jgi:hypothetical protein